MSRVKVCGLTRHEDVQLAVELGAWALGFIFYPKSPRYVDLNKVASINDRLDAGYARKFASGLRIGVFVDPELETLLTSVKAARLDGVQLHGHETPEFCVGVKKKLPGVRLFKAFRPRDEADLLAAQEYVACDGLLVDTFSKDRLGGSGLTSDWNLAQKLTQSPLPVILSGGLNVDNVSAAIAQVKPYALDLSSGLEESPGVKSHAKMRKFFSFIRSLP